jgi:tetratricopeptide (TPR) repeat protein
VLAAMLPLAAAAAGADQPVDDAGHSAASLYNAANSYARQGKVALAILYYERARVLAPNDPDVVANLEHVRKVAGLATETGSWFENHTRLGNPNLLFWCGVAGIALLATGMLVLRFNRRRLRLGWVAAIAGVPLFAAAMVDCASTMPVLREAVILRAGPARVSPVPGGDALFTLPAGQVVWVTDHYHDYELIKTDSGRTGWVATDDVAPVT